MPVLGIGRFVNPDPAGPFRVRLLASRALRVVVDGDDGDVGMADRLPLKVEIEHACVCTGVDVTGA
jgi:hypothetical protein